MQLNPPFFYTKKKSGFLTILVMMLVSVYVFSSCAPIRRSAYFKTLKKDTTLQGFVNKDFDSRIQKKDVLGITVSSMSKDIDDKFNNVGPVVSLSQSVPVLGYLVDEQGTVTIHYSGTIKAEGLTRKELKKNIEAALLPYMKEPIVTVQYLNHKVTILGEIANPKVLNMPEEQLSLIDVLVLGGDVKENASLSNVMIIREANNEKQIKYVNLEDNSIFSSPWYYVKPNDIIYILPDNEKYVKEEKRRKLQTTLSLVASLASLVVIVLNIILR